MIIFSLHSFAKKLASLFVKANIIEEENAHIYVYPFETLLSTILSVTIVFIIAIYKGMLLETFCFLLIGFIPIRRLAGGYHAKTHYGCLLILLAVYVLFLIAISVIPVELYAMITILCICVSTILVWAFAPVGTPNKTIDDEKKLLFKRRSRKAILMYLFLIPLFLIVRNKVEVLCVAILCTSAGVLSAAVSLLAERIKILINTERRKGNE